MKYCISGEVINMVKSTFNVFFNDFLEEFKKDMLQKFIDHDDKWGERSVIRDNWEGQLISEDELRQEIHYHYAKWIYRGVEKKTLCEEDTLTNLANMIFLLWIKIRSKKRMIRND